MTSLTLKNIPNPLQDFESVDVSAWFGEDENGEPFTINVHGMTVQKKALLTRYVNEFYLADSGEWASRPKLEADSSTVIAAICSYDDDGNLTFGIDYMDAIRRCESLPETYRGCLIALATVALRLTGSMDKEAVDSAEKN